MKVLHDLSRDAITALGNDHLADLWLNRPSRLFDGMTPAQALDHPTHRTRAMNQLKWFAGINKETLNISESRLNYIVDDPIVHLALASAGSGPEELLALCQRVRSRNNQPSTKEAA